MLDVRAALRLLRHRPWFCASVVITLAVALGAATAIFTLVHALILKPLPFEDADRIVTIEATVADAGGRLSLREYRDLERDSRAFSRWAAYYRSQYNLTGGGTPEALTCTIGSSTLFEVLGVRPIYGDIWLASQDFTREFLVVLSHRLWQQRFGGRPDVVGSTMVMDGGTYRVTGVLPAGFDYPLQTDIFRSVTDYNAPHVRRYSAVARLRPGITHAEAQSELNAFAERFARDYPDTNAGVSLRATPLRDAYVGRARPFLWLLLAAVALLLVIAAVNVTNLLVARAIASSGDAAVRLAMGASRRHLVRQSVSEALVLTFLGAVLGALGARWALQAITAMVAADLPPWFRIELDATVLLVAIGVALLTAFAVGAMPALQAATGDVERVLRQESARSAASPRQQNARRILLAGQAAFATLLLVSAALFATALRDLLKVDVGFEPASVVTFRVDPPWGRYPDIPTTSQFYRRAIEEISATPGVEAAGTNTFLPFSGLDVVSPRVRIEGRDTGRADEQPFVNFQIVDAGYFRSMRIPLQSGRAFEWTDDAQAPPVAVVSERAARRFWGTEDPIGRRLSVVWNQLGVGAGNEANLWLTVVGVAGNVRFTGVDDDGALDVYAPNAQLFAGDSYFVVRTGMNAAAARTALRRAIDRVDPEQSFFDVHSMRARIDGSIWQHRVATVVLTLFAVVALVLAVIGTYAVTAHAVAGQRREIGIRLALGSSSREISRLVLVRWLSPIGAGTLVGAVLGAVSARALTRVLGTGELPDIVIPAAMPVALIVAAAIACYVPIRSTLRKVGITEALRTGGVVLAFACGIGTATAQDSGSVSGTVVADDGGRPLAGVKVLIATPPRETTTSADGRFAFGNLGRGGVTIIFTHDGYATLSEAVVVEPGQTVTLDVRMPPAPTLSEELTVVGRLSDYVEASASASKTSARLIDVPQAIVVLPSRFLEDLGALDTKELYRHISGVEDSPYSSTVVRGFTQREVLVNGVRGNPYGSLDGDVNNSGFSTSQFRLTNVERVEVLKGPSSVLYGSGEPGGVINYITRKPRETFEARATIGTGQYSQALGEAEVTGPANASRTLLYRGAVYVEDRDSFRFNANIRNVHAVGGLAWRPSARSTIGLEYEYIDQANNAHRLRGVPVDAQGTFLADYRWTVTEPTDFTDLNAHVAQLHLDQALGATLRLDSTLRYVGYDRHENYHEPRGITGGTLMQREFRDQLRTNDDWSWGLNLFAPMVTRGAGRHDLAVGADVVRQDHLFRFATARQQSAGGLVPPLSLANPAYRTTAQSAYGLTPERFSTDTAETTRTGVYVQDLVSLGPRWNVLIGGRWDRYDDSGASTGFALAADHSAATGRLGIVFKPQPALSIYGSIANGFSRGSILSQTPSANGPHDPETSRQVEVGAKSEWLEGRVQLTAAFFNARKENVLRPDPGLGPSGTNFNAVLATGEVRNRGVEIDLAGALTPHWNLAFNYAYLDSQITHDLVASLVGRPMPNAPPHAVGLFTRVDLPRGAAVGGSLEYVDDRVEPFAGIRAPAYTIVDAHYFQQITPRLRVLLRVENLFDRQYAASSLFAARAGNMPGQPRTASIALTITSRHAGPAPAP